MSSDLKVRPASLAKFREELAVLRQRRQGELGARLREARESYSPEDESDLQAVRNEIDLVEERMQYLLHVLNVGLPLERDTEALDRVALGCEIAVRDLDTGEDWDLILVSSVEADPLQDLISVDCPVGQALLGRRVGEVVLAEVPDGALRLEIVALN